MAPSLLSGVARSVQTSMEQSGGTASAAKGTPVGSSKPPAVVVAPFIDEQPTASLPNGEAEVAETARLNEQPASSRVEQLRSEVGAATSPSKKVRALRDDVESSRDEFPVALLAALTALDDELVEVLGRGDIRLVRTAWVLDQPAEYVMPRRQELERLERSGASPSPLLSPEEAVALVRRGTRSAGVLSHPWFAPGNPDPMGFKIRIMRKAFCGRCAYVEGFFLDFSSLYQAPRTVPQQASFNNALGRMGDLYASAIGTTVLQLKEIPPCPLEFKGALYVGMVYPGVDVPQLQDTLSAFGPLVAGGCSLHTQGELHQYAIVRFTSHASAEQAAQANASTLGVGEFFTLHYNELEYDHRGWCSFESAVSSELILRCMAEIPKIRVELDKLPSKVVCLSSTAETQPIDFSADAQLDSRVSYVVKTIKDATFTGRADKDKVPKLYMDYVDKIASMLTKTLSLLPGSFAAKEDAAALLPLPVVSVEPTSPLRLAVGQLVLAKGDASRAAAGGGEGRARFGAVVEAGRVSLTISGDEAELSYDACDQAVLPWSPASASSGWDEALLSDVRSLPALRKRADRLHDNAHALGPTESVEKTRLEVKEVQKEAEELLKAMESNRPIARHATQGAAEIRSSIDAAIEGADRQDFSELRKKVEAAVAKLQFEPESAAAAALQRCGNLGLRRYTADQWLSVQFKGAWRDARVLAASSEHRLQIEGEGEESLVLHPWNHAPRELPMVAFEALHGWWAQSLRAQHGKIADALTGKPLDAMKQCVAIDVTGDRRHGWSDVNDVHGLSRWLHSLHSARSTGKATSDPGAALLTAPPAAGKTTMISQAVVLALEKAEMVPIVIKVQLLQARLSRAVPHEYDYSYECSRKNPCSMHGYEAIICKNCGSCEECEYCDGPDAKRVCDERELSLQSSWNGIDAYLRLEHADRPEVYRMLRQAMMARRALLLIDGLDEGGTHRAEIERHVVEVLAAQGHVILCTSRPAGVDEARFAGFRRLKLAPLTEAQQAQALRQRLGEAGVEKLMVFVDRMPMDTDPDTGAQHRVTANPLMLSMVASVFEIRKGVDMPKTIAQLYNDASKAMLARGGGVSAELQKLLQAVLFEAHAAQSRVITEVQLRRAALAVWAPGTLAELERGSLSQDLSALQHAVNSLPSETAKRAVEAMRARVRQDMLPLLSLLQVEPLQMQSSHLSFQEYYTATAICSGEYRLPKGSPPPWQWPVFWANTVKLGGEMDEAFGKGLLRAAGVVSEELDLSHKLVVGDQPTAVAAVAQLMRALTSLSISGNKLSDESKQAIGAALHSSMRLFACNQVKLQADATSLDLCRMGLGPGDAALIGGALRSFMGSVTNLSISGNKLSDESKQTIGAALQCSMRMFVCDQLTLQADATSLDLRRKGLGAGDAALIGGALRSFMRSVTVMDMRYNRLGTESATMLANVAKAKGISLCGITPEQIEADFTPQKNSGERMGPADAILLTADLSVRAVTSVSMAYNMIEGNGAQQLAWTVLAKPSLEIFSGIPLKELRADSLTTLDLSTKGLGVPEAIVLAGILQSVSSSVTKILVASNQLGDEGATAICNALRESKVTRVQELDLGTNGIGPDGAKAVAELCAVCASVASLSLDNNELGDEGATVIARALKESKVSKLASLDLSGKGYGDRLIGKASAKELAEYLLVSDSITSLSTTYSDMSGEEAQQLAWAVLAKPTLEIFSGIPLKELRSESLTKLDLEGKGLGVPEAMVLADLLRSVCTSVTEVNLDGYPLPIKQLKGTEPTESIDLSSRHLGFVSAIVIASLIEGNAVLTTLDLSLNNLNAEAGKALAEALKSGCPALTGLDLAFNSLGPQGGAAIASALRGNAVLIHLSIGSNKLGAGSGAAIASALPVNKMLKSIDLSDNDLGPNGCTAIANTLSLSTLTDLNIASNNIGGFWSQVKQRDLHTEEWVTEMAEALRVSQVLSSVDLRNNVLSQEAYSVIKNAAGSLLELKLEQSNLLCGGKHPRGSD